MFWNKSDKETELEQKKALRKKLTNELGAVASKLDGPDGIRQRTENASASRNDDGKFAQAVRIQNAAAPEIARLAAEKERLERELNQVKKEVHVIAASLFTHDQCGTVFESRALYEGHLKEARKLTNPTACAVLGGSTTETFVRDRKYLQMGSELKPLA